MADHFAHAGKKVIRGRTVAKKRILDCSAAAGWLGNGNVLAVLDGAAVVKVLYGDGPRERRQLENCFPGKEIVEGWVQLDKLVVRECLPLPRPAVPAAAKEPLVIVDAPPPPPARGPPWGSSARAGVGSGG